MFKSNLIKIPISSQLEEVAFKKLQEIALLRGIIERFNDGILIITEQREIIYLNERAKKICHCLNQEIEEHNFAPSPIWRVCQILTENRSLFPDSSSGFYDDIVTNNADEFRVCVQWINLPPLEGYCFLVTIKNQCQSLPSMAIIEAQVYGLTPSETKVWLLYRANYTYKQVGAELYITINTVKKHMKNIYAKRQAILTNNE